MLSLSGSQAQLGEDPVHVALDGPGAHEELLGQCRVGPRRGRGLLRRCAAGRRPVPAQRTAAEFARLFAAAGLRLTRVIATTGVMSLLEAERRGATAALPVRAPSP